MEISFKDSLGAFNYRVAGVVLKGDKILLLTEDRFDFWYLPGGKAKLLETSEQALIREISEEFSEKPKIERILWINECLYYFKDWDVKHHDLTFYYLISLPEASKIYANDSGLALEEHSNEETVLRYKWFAIDEINRLNLVPEFLKKSLKDIPASPQHVITNELPISI